jgi:hypothetical protein
MFIADFGITTGRQDSQSGNTLLFIVIFNMTRKTIFNTRLKPYFKSEISFISLLYLIVCGFVFNSTERTNGSFTSPNYPGLRTDSIDCFDVWLK